MLKGQTPAKDKIKKEEFEKLCSMWCTLVEIADFFNVSEDTVESWCKDVYSMRFSEVYKRKCSKGNILLRRWQMKSAEKGNVTMQIWLGKQHLGQREKLEVENENNNGVLTELVEALSNAKKS